MDDSNSRRSTSLTWALVGFLVATGCSVRGIRADDLPQPTIRASWLQAGIKDQRLAFADVFCRRLRESGAEASTCEQWLWPMTGTVATPPGLEASPLLRLERTLVVVPGILGECIAPWVTPYSEDYVALEAMGYRVKVLPLKGRGSSAINARIIHEHLSDPALGLRDAVVIAYSKGVTDFMLAASQPEAAAWRRDVSAFVSIAGTANGSPAANHGAGLYRRLLSRRPFRTCDESDGGGVSSLTYVEALGVVDNFSASDPPFATYSIVAVAARGPVNPVLVGFHDLLSRIDERNDGQVLMEDAVVPGSTVLGIFRADHWSIALPFEDSESILMRPLSQNNSFPRGALVRAILEYTAPVAGPPATIKEH